MFHGHPSPWRYPEKRAHELDAAGRIYVPRNGGVPRLKRYLHEHPGIVPGSIWTDIPPVQSHAKERVGYSTQKPLVILDRIIKASSNPGDLVLEPFCGCATALVAAERLKRKWVGIDLSEKAVELVRMRLRDVSPSAETSPLFDKVVHRTDLPRRIDRGAIPDYRTHKHTLYGRQEGACGGCRTMFPFRNMTVDHVVPQSKGGDDHLDNLQLLCGACNSMKGTGSQAEFVAKLRRERLRT